MLRIWTDGSCWPTNGGPGGWAFVVEPGDHGPVVEYAGGLRRTTNNRAEMLAVIRALQWLKGRPGKIHSDSQLCVNTLTLWAPGWKARGWRKKDGSEPSNLELVVMAYDLYTASNARIGWVRGHVGHQWNERADELAGLARKSIAETLEPQAT